MPISSVRIIHPFVKWSYYNNTRGLYCTQLNWKLAHFYARGIDRLLSNKLSVINHENWLFTWSIDKLIYWLIDWLIMIDLFDCLSLSFIQSVFLLLLQMQYVSATLPLFRVPVPFILQLVVFFPKYSNASIFCEMSISSWNTFSTVRGSLRDGNKFEMCVTI